MIRLQNLLREAIWAREQGRPKDIPASMKILYKLHDKIKDTVWAGAIPTRYDAKRTMNLVDKLYKGTIAEASKGKFTDKYISKNLKSAEKYVNMAKSHVFDSDEEINRMFSETDDVLGHVHDALDRMAHEIHYGEPTTNAYPF